MYEAPFYVWLMIMTAVVGFPISAALVVYRGSLAAEVPRRAAFRAGAGVLALLAIWIGAMWVWAETAFEGETPDQAGLRVGLSFTVILVLLLLARRIPVVSRSVSSPGSLVRMTLPHTLRVMGGVFLIVMAQGWLPAVFALPAGLGDIAVGVSAPFVAQSLARGDGRRRALWFNVLGLLDLVVAVGIGLLAGAGAVGLIDVSPTTAALAGLPLVLVPVLAVPLAITLHVTSLRQLRQGQTAVTKAPNSVYSTGG
jgi:hypothetical protein